jgi:NADH-quinone oxidoreductase subunit I
MAKIVSIKRGLWEQLYIPEIVRGVGITLRHFFLNTFGSREIVTVRYPEEKREYPPRFRGVHRLMKREDDSVRCVACMMCSTICPAQCIYITAGERSDGALSRESLDGSPPQRSESAGAPQIEKYPVSFEIDELICVVCGMCVEACPCDAIRMDTGRHYPPVDRRDQAFMQKEDLLAAGSRNIAVQGGAGPDWRESYQPLGAERQIYDREGKLSKQLKGS